MQTVLGIATTCLFVRTVFRSVELSGGFSGQLANSEVEFIILDGVMVLLACTSLTVMHPGYGFGGNWIKTRFSFRKLDGTKNAESTEEQATVVANRENKMVSVL